VARWRLQENRGAEWNSARWGLAVGVAQPRGSRVEMSRVAWSRPSSCGVHIARRIGGGGGLVARALPRWPPGDSEAWLSARHSLGRRVPRPPSTARLCFQRHADHQHRGSSSSSHHGDKSHKGSRYGDGVEERRSQLVKGTRQTALRSRCRSL
jgi:hypothetical protein